MAAILVGVRQSALRYTVGGSERAEWIRFAESVLDVYDEERVIDEETRDIEGFPY